MARPLLLTLILALLIAADHASAQDVPQVFVEVDRDGLYEISWSDIEPHADPRLFTAERTVLFDGTTELPIFMRGVDSRGFERSSSVIFYCDRGTSPHSARRVLRLTLGQPGERIREVPPPPAQDSPVTEAVVTAEFEEDLIFDPMETVRADLLDLPREQREHWFWRRIAPTTGKSGAQDENWQSMTMRLEPGPRSVDGGRSTLAIRVRSHLSRQASQSLAIELSGESLGEQTWSETNLHTATYSIPNERLKEFMVLRLANTSKETEWADAGNQVSPRFANDILVDSITVSYRALLRGPTTRDPQISYALAADTSRRGPSVLEFVNLQTEPFRIYDVSRRLFVRGRRIETSFDRPRRFVVVGPDGFRRPSRVRAPAGRDLRQETGGGDWVVVALDRFTRALQPLADLRAAQGLVPFVVSDAEVYDSFSGGAFDPDAMTRLLAHGFANWKVKPRFLLLVGDADRDVDWISKQPVLPTKLVTTLYNGASASDAALVEGLPAPVAVGRLPVRRTDELIRILEKIRTYETSPEGGEWRRRLSFVAGEGRFGPVVDRLLESYTTDMLSKRIPAGYDVSMTYANPSSPYVYPADLFNQKVIDRFNQGSLIYTYIGHGFQQGFDSLRLGSQRHPIFWLADVARLEAAPRTPAMAIIACSTAYFDDPKVDSIGEELIRSKGGPVALIGSTRISHPFPNAILGKELIGRLFAERDTTLGEILASAKRAMAEHWQEDEVAPVASVFLGGIDRQRLMEDHVHLYTLFGDPAMRLAYPNGDIALDVPNEARMGSILLVRGTSDLEGAEAEVTVEARRNRIVHPVERVSLKDPRSRQQVMTNYENANDKVIARARVPVANGAFEAQLALPGGFPAGSYVVKVFATSGSRCAMGSTTVEVGAGL